MKKIHKFLLSFLALNYYSFAAAEVTRDPTLPPQLIIPNAVNVGNGALSLTMIFIYPDKRLAIINNQIVTVGTKIGEFTITTITPYTVELVGPQDKKEVLSLVLPVKKER